MSPGRSPIRVAVVNDYEMVVAGVAAMLEQHPDRVRVVEIDIGVSVISDVDVILYDTFGQVQGDGVDLEDLVHDVVVEEVAHFLGLDPETVDPGFGGEEDED